MKHGCAKRSSKERLYGVWLGIKARCLYPNATGYKDYGGRGVGICEEWKNSYESFRAWALSNGYDPNAPYGKCMIERIDVNKDYCPENCHWIPQIDNSKYKATTHLYTAHKEIHTGREWAKICNLGTNTINTIARNYSVEIAEKFIEARLDSPNEERIGNESWLEHYGII